MHHALRDTLRFKFKSFCCRSQGQDEALDYLKALKDLPINLAVLTSTRIGMTVNAIRKKSENEEVNNLTKALIKKWKKLLPGNYQTVYILAPNCRYFPGSKILTQDQLTQKKPSKKKVSHLKKPKNLQKRVRHHQRSHQKTKKDPPAVCKPPSQPCHHLQQTRLGSNAVRCCALLSKEMALL